MKKYLAVFVAPVEAYDKMKEEMKSPSPEAKQKEMDDWKAWMDKYSSSIVDPGGGVGSAKRVSEGGAVSDVHNEIGGYMILQAENIDEVVDIFKDGPHSDMPEGAVEVMEIMSM